jgi:hypothetical protein
MQKINFKLASIDILTYSQITAIISKLAGLIVSGLTVYFGYKNTKYYENGLRRKIFDNSTVLMSEEVNIF